jgi:hypothetical protein
MLVGAPHHGVAFEMPDPRAVLGAGGALGDRALAGEPAAAVVAAIALAPLLPRAAELRVQHAAALTILPDVAIDRLMTDRQAALGREASGDLLRAPLLGQARPHEVPGVATEAPIPAGPCAAPRGIPVGEFGPVVAVVALGIAAQLAANGAPVAPEYAGDGGGGAPLPPEQAEGVAFSGGDLR